MEIIEGNSEGPLEMTDDAMEAWSDATKDVQHVGQRVLKDTSKPDGDACRPDGKLKEASEMEWLHSPSEHNETRLRRRLSISSESDDDVLPKAKVSEVMNAWQGLIRD